MPEDIATWQKSLAVPILLVPMPENRPTLPAPIKLPSAPVPVSDLLYQLNAQDEISSVNEEWLSFAQANEGNALLAPRILGRRLWDFMGDRETEHIYRQLHRRVRAGHEPIRITFRCDGPERRRLLELDISAGSEDGLTYRVRTVRQEDRPAVPLLDPHQPRSEEFVTMCGWCKRVAVGAGEWLAVEEAVVALSLFDEPRPPQLTHGICEECSRRVDEALESDSVRLVVGSL